MSDEITKNLKKWGSTAAVVAALFGGGTAWTLLPYRMDASEKRIQVLEESLAAQQKQISAMETTLARIDERTKAMAQHMRIPTKD